MFTNNVRPWLANSFLGTFNLAAHKCKSQNGKSFTSTVAGYSPADIYTLISKLNISGFVNGNSSVPNANHKGIVFGTGTTPPTVNDYNLSGSMVTGFGTSNTSISVDKYINEKDVSIQADITLSNNTGASVTIREVALFDSVYGRTTETSSTNYSYSIMVERTVLDTPVTIPAGGVGKIFYRVTLNTL